MLTDTGDLPGGYGVTLAGLGEHGFDELEILLYFSGKLAM
jgi:hypothetical protein